MFNIGDRVYWPGLVYGSQDSDPETEDTGVIVSEVDWHDKTVEVKWDSDNQVKYIDAASLRIL